MDGGRERGEVDGLGEMDLEARGLASLHVLLHAVARESDALEAIVLSEHLHQLKACAVWETDVADHQIELALLSLRHLERAQGQITD
jgi:DNA-binding FrmR family transcriptional regulator